jgi:hypothetical protein
MKILHYQVLCSLLVGTLLPNDVSALSEARFQEKSVHERGAPARFR